MIAQIFEFLVDYRAKLDQGLVRNLTFRGENADRFMDLRDFYLELINSLRVVFVQFKLFGIHLVLYLLVFLSGIKSRVIFD